MMTHGHEERIYTTTPTRGGMKETCRTTLLQVLSELAIYNLDNTTARATRVTFMNDERPGSLMDVNFT